MSKDYWCGPGEVWSCWFIFYCPFLVASCVSGVASTCMLVWMHRLLRGRPAKLMLRQLWHLALSDLFSAVFSALWSLHPLVGMMLREHDGKRPEHPRSISVWCIGARVTWRSGNQVSRLVEIHIALSCLACVCRRTRFLNCRYHSFILLWLLGILISTVLVLQSQFYWDSADGFCNWVHAGGFEIDGLLLLVEFVVSVSAYAMSVIVIRRSGGNAAHCRILRRTKLYIISSAVTFAPFVLWSLVPETFTYLNTVLYVIAFTLMELNGFTNTCAYAIQSRSIMNMSGDMFGIDRPLSIQATDSPRPPALAAAGFNVTFEASPDVIQYDSGSVASFTAPPTTRSRVESAEDFFDHLQGAYDQQLDDDDDDDEPSTRTPRVPAWRRKMEQSQRIQRARAAAISDYNSRP